MVGEPWLRAGDEILAILITPSQDAVTRNDPRHGDSPIDWVYVIQPDSTGAELPPTSATWLGRMKQFYAKLNVAVTLPGTSKK
jgi:hypothetical protein